MKPLFLLFLVLSPIAHAYDNFVLRQASAIDKQRELILDMKRKGEFRGGRCACRHFVATLAELKQNAILTAESMRKDPAPLRDVPILAMAETCGAPAFVPGQRAELVKKRARLLRELKGEHIAGLDLCGTVMRMVEDDRVKSIRTAQALGEDPAPLESVPAVERADCR